MSIYEKPVLSAFADMTLKDFMDLLSENALVKSRLSESEPPADGWRTLRETARFLRIAPVTLRHWINAGKFPPPDRGGGGKGRKMAWKLDTIKDWSDRRA